MDPFITPTFVGRSHELEELHAALDAVLGNNPRCVLLSGDAGIGKSRLIAEIQAAAQEKGFTSLSGRCFYQDRSFPYAPLVDMLRPFVQSDAALELLDSLGSQAQLLVRLLPELASRLSAPQSDPALELEVEKRRLFEFLTALFLRQAQLSPLLLVVEDLHWSDEASLEFLLHLLRHLGRHPILLLLSARSAAAGTAWNELMLGLDRQPNAQEITLLPLSRVETGQLLQAILRQAHPPSGEFVEAIYALGEGNPFFAEEICTSLIASGDLYFTGSQWRRTPLSQIEIPDSIQRVVRQRLDRVSSPARRLIDLAAISGRSFDVVVLKALTQQDDAELLSLLKELIAAHLLVEESADRFAFRHALTREALYERLLARERQGLHRQLVEAIERVHAGALEAHLEALAYHTFEAGLWRPALEYAQQAGEKALALDAPHAAVEHLSRAIHAAGHLSLLAGATLHRLRGRAFDILGDFDRARDDYETALGAARQASDQKATWQLLLDLALLWASRDYERTGDYCRQALDLAQAMADRAAIAHSLNRLGNWLMNRGQLSEALDYHRQALDHFQALDEPAGIAATLDLLAMTSNMSGRYIDTMSYYRQAIPILRRLNDRQTLATSLTMLSNYTLDEALVREALQLTRELGWRSGEAYALQYLGSLLAYKGDVGQGLANARSGLELARAIDHRLWQAWGHTVLGIIHLELIALEAASRHLQSARTIALDVGSSFMTTLASGLLTSTYIQQERLDDAAALLPREFPDAVQGVDFAPMKAAAEWHLARGQPAQALAILDWLESQDCTNWVGAMSYFYGSILLVRAETLMHLQRLPGAQADLRSAVDTFEQTGARLALWRAHAALGKLYDASGDLRQSAAEITAARDAVAEVAATIPDDDLRQNFQRRALASIPSAPSLTPRQAAKMQFDGLTRREREVAAVVARGLSNQEIADELVISIKTVEAHITRILSKLDFSSRAQIAAWAVEKGLKL